ncbi:MAG TPA: YfhO family protein [Thermoanaerobaculia bacterium]|nr:YfhO family protein [Thermoanaerobaculia bacterium]
MAALLLYLATTIALIACWRKFVQPMSRTAAIVLVLLPLCFTGRALLTGKVYAPTDLPFMSEPLNAYAAEFGVPKVHNGTLSDLYCQIIPWRSAVRTAFASGQWPLLNPFMLCGDILAAAAQPAPYDPFNLLGMLIPLPPSLTFAAAMTFFLAGFGAFVFMRLLGCGELAALVTAAGWMFSGNVAFFVGWPLARSWVYLPLIFFAVRLVVREASIRGGVILLIALTLLILSGHPESLLHVTAVGAAYGLFEIATTRKRIGRAIAIASTSGIVALLLTSIFLLPFLEASQQTLELRTRLGDRAMPLPFKPELIQRRAANTVFPFWGGQPWRDSFTPEFDPQTARTGSIVVSLAIASLFVARRRKETWFFFGLALVCLCAAFGAPPMSNILHKLPLFNMALNERLAFAAACAISILAGLTIDEVAADAAGRKRVAIIAAVIALALALGTYAAWAHEMKVGVDPNVIQIVAFAEVLPLAAIAILLFARTPLRIASPLVLILILGQRIVADGSIYPSLPQHDFYPKIPLIRAIPTDSKEPFRVAGEHFVLIPDSAAIYQLEDPRGYEAMTFARLADTYPVWSIPQPVSFNAIGDLQPPFLSFLNIKYAIVPMPVKLTPGWREVMKDRSAKLFENTRVLPRAFVPRHIRYEQSGGPIVKAMTAANDFSDTAWIEVPELAPHEIANGPGTLTLHKDGFGLSIDAVMENDGWIVASQSAWKGWRAYIDGRRVQTRFANHAFLGVFVPKGRHNVKLQYLPESFTRGRNISFTTLGALILAAIFPSARRRFQKPRTVRV